ncbi:hypothetical protein GWK47_025916 [Chionoecetes opilio]|uniref:Uncharacterized protein n=1 Tax=Chionoecetes opilio TaxID=41210 RepID=A0A8J8WFV9_CHIOP|nr:hypothetical protein GWK47_025916 [Chionoecetes opilio]
MRPKDFKARFLSLFVFKLPVVRLLYPEKVDAVKSRLLFEVTEQAVLDTSEGSSPYEDKKDDFFKLCSCGETVIPGSDIMKAKRAGLTSDNFERLVFMKTWTCSIWNCHQRTLNEESEVKGLISYH